MGIRVVKFIVSLVDKLRSEWWLIALFHSDPGSTVTVSIDFSCYLSLYLLPEVVLTICPALAPRGTGDVVIFVPFL